MKKWSAGIQRGLVWTHHGEAPESDTQAEAEAWLRNWLLDQPEPTRSAGLFTVRQMTIMELP
jgi:hypothetical protein